MGTALKIKVDLSSAALRQAALRERDGRAAARMFAIANALDGLSRAESSRLAGMERQALRDAVVRYNAEGLAGLHDRPKGRPPRRLAGEEEAALVEAILRGPDPAEDGCCAWTRADLCRWLETHHGKTYHPSSMTRVLRRLGFSRQKARPYHPKRDAEAQDAFKKGGLAEAIAEATSRHRDKRIELWFEDEARVGNKGRVCHRWWRRGERPPGVQQLGYQWAYIFAAIRPATGEDVTLVLPTVNATAMQVFFDHVAASRPPDAHVLMVLDGAGWHQSLSLAVPDTITLVVLPPYSPELNPVERVWLYLRDRFLSLRVFETTDAIIDACCEAWNRLIAETGRLRSLCAYPWIEKVAS